MEKKRSVGVIIWGIIDVIIGLLFLPTLIMLQGPNPLFVLGILYLILGIGILKSAIKFKLLLYGIIPFTIWSSATIIAMSAKNVPPGFRTPLKGGIIFTVIVSLICLAHIYYFTRPKVKEQFK